MRSIYCYVVHPAEMKMVPKLGLLFLTDALVHAAIDTQSLADALTERGCSVLVPGFFHSCPAPESASRTRMGPFDENAWQAQRTVDRVDPIITRALTRSRHDFGCTRVGSVACCCGTNSGANSWGSGGQNDCGADAKISGRTPEGQATECC